MGASIADPIPNAVRSELSWTHYRSLMRVEDKDASKVGGRENLISGPNI